MTLSALPRALARIGILGIAVLVAAWPQAGAAQPHRAAAAKPARAAPHPKTTSTTTTNVPNALQGFSKNRDEPVQIESDALEIRDKDKKATFSGKVHVVQGDTDVRCATLVVYYEDDQKAATVGAKAAPTTTEGQRIRRLEAMGNVIVTQKDQTATGDRGEFDMHANTITLIGHVVVSQGKNVLRGDRLFVDLNTNISRVESTGGRVQGLFQAGGARKPGEAGKDAPSLAPHLN